MGAYPHYRDRVQVVEKGIDGEVKGHTREIVDRAKVTRVRGDENNQL